MDDMNENEDRALEALIVNRMRGECEKKELSDEEKKHLRSLKPGFITNLYRDYKAGKIRRTPKEEEEEENLVCGASGHMNRADEIDETDELTERRKKVRKELHEKKNAERDT